MKVYAQLVMLLGMSLNLGAMEISFKTARESGQMSIRNHQIMYITPQKSSSLAIKECNKPTIEKFKRDVLKLAKKEDSRSKENIKGSISIDGRVILLNLDSKLYEIFDNFHSSIQDLKTQSQFECLKDSRRKYKD